MTELGYLLVFAIGFWLGRKHKAWSFRRILREAGRKGITSIEIFTRSC